MIYYHGGCFSLGDLSKQKIWRIKGQVNFKMYLIRVFEIIKDGYDVFLMKLVELTDLIIISIE